MNRIKYCYYPESLLRDEYIENVEFYSFYPFVKSKGVTVWSTDDDQGIHSYTFDSEEEQLKFCFQYL